MTIAEAAEVILRERRSPMHASEIAKAISANGLYSFRAKDPASVVASALYSRIEKEGGEAKIQKVGPSTFALK